MSIVDFLELEDLTISENCKASIFVTRINNANVLVLQICCLNYY